MRIDNTLLRYESLLEPGAAGAEKKSGGAGSAGPTFREILSDRVRENDLVFSKHAQQRISERDISLGDGDLSRLRSAVRLAGSKGVQNTLVFMDSNAYIVNVPSGKVITAIGENDLKNSVFTQIDGAVIV